MRTRVSLSVVYILLITPSASADFVGVTTVIKDDPDTEFLCTQGNGDFVPGPLTVCNVFASLDGPDDVLLGVGNADLQVYNGVNPDVFYQHPIGNGNRSPSCFFIPFFPDLICDSFVTIGRKCNDNDDASSPGPEFNCDPSIPNLPPPDDECADNPAQLDWFNCQDNAPGSGCGHIWGGWFNFSWPNGQGHARNHPDLEVLTLQSSVAVGLSLSGDIDLFWWPVTHHDIFVEIDVPVECAAACPADLDGDGSVGAPDLAILLGSWGPCEGCPADFDGDGMVNAPDLAQLLGAWGVCP